MKSKSVQDVTEQPKRVARGSLRRIVSPCPTCGNPPAITSGVGGYYVACFHLECLANNFAPKSYGIPRKRTRPLACAEWNKKWANGPDQR